MLARELVADYTIAILEHAIQVLETFLKQEEPLSLAQVTRESGLSKSKVFRILHTLEKHQYVERDLAGAYRLGIRFLDFGRRVQQEMDLLGASQAVMDWLAGETRESIFLGVLDGKEALCIDARQSSHSIRLSAQIGQRTPFYAGGVPKVLLAFLPEDERSRLLAETELRQITPYTIVDRAELEASLAEIRRLDYVVTVGDLDEGAHSIAAPIRDHEGQVIAAISIAGPSERFTEPTVERYVALIMKGAACISHTLGYQDDRSIRRVPVQFGGNEL
jgi:IclR family KDG regulon transcriptional repressor